MNDYLLGDVVRKYRQENHLSLRAFGEMCGISHTTIDCIEKGYDPRTGKRVNITNMTFSKLSDVLKIPVSEEISLSYIPKETAIVPPLTPGITFAIPINIPRMISITKFIIFLFSPILFPFETHIEHEIKLPFVLLFQS